ncbi:MAG TPA: PilZ domain-containing protein [Blastocatellia bacterium]|nr:PilZ domain-containing protein [Blastocatellia bacterium]
MRDYLYGDVEIIQDNLGIWDFRLYRRIPILRPVKYIDAKFGETNSMMANLSLGGAYIESPVVPMGSEIEMEFALFDRYTVHATGVVRHFSLNTGMGVEFKQVRAEDRHQITRFINIF